MPGASALSKIANFFIMTLLGLLCLLPPAVIGLKTMFAIVGKHSTPLTVFITPSWNATSSYGLTE